MGKASGVIRLPDEEADDAGSAHLEGHESTSLQHPEPVLQNTNDQWEAAAHVLGCPSPTPQSVSYQATSGEPAVAVSADDAEAVAAEGWALLREERRRKRIEDNVQRLIGSARSTRLPTTGDISGNAENGKSAAIDTASDLGGSVAGSSSGAADDAVGSLSESKCRNTSKDRSGHQQKDHSAQRRSTASGWWRATHMAKELLAELRREAAELAGADSLEGLHGRSQSDPMPSTTVLCDTSHQSLSGQPPVDTSTSMPLPSRPPGGEQPDVGKAATSDGISANVPDVLAFSRQSLIKTLIRPDPPHPGRGDSSPAKAARQPPKRSSTSTSSLTLSPKNRRGSIERSRTTSIESRRGSIKAKSDGKESSGQRHGDNDKAVSPQSRVADVVCQAVEFSGQQMGATWPMAKSKHLVPPTICETTISKPACRPKTSALKQEIVEHKDRLAKNTNMARRVKRFDHRVRKFAREQTSGNLDALHSDFEDSEPATTNVVWSKEDVELGFNIVGCSSQKPPNLASTLTQPHGKWESANSHVHNEYLIFELAGPPDTVTGIELTVGGSSANPRRCRMQYTESLADGSWHDAWSFTVEAKNMASSWLSRHQYGKVAQHFKELLFEHCGDVEVAWQFLDTNGSGRLSLVDFQAAVARLERLMNFAHFTELDLQRVFRETDLTGTGMIALDDLLCEGEPRQPMATWWRLLIVENWGSPASVMLSAPVRMFSTVKRGAGKDYEIRRSHRDAQARFLEELVTAFHPDKLQLTPEVRMLRRVAQEYEVPLNEVEDIYHQFNRHDSDHNGALDRSEFEALLLVLHGVKDKADVPRSRFEFFWRQADQDSSGAVDFEEFLVWYTRHLVGSGLPLGRHAMKQDMRDTVMGTSLLHE